jgi:hypothetical protein
MKYTALNTTTVAEYDRIVKKRAVYYIAVQ